MLKERLLTKEDYHWRFILLVKSKNIIFFSPFLCHLKERRNLLVVLLVHEDQEIPGGKKRQIT